MCQFKEIILSVTVVQIVTITSGVENVKTKLAGHLYVSKSFCTVLLESIVLFCIYELASMSKHSRMFAV